MVSPLETSGSQRRRRPTLHKLVSFLCSQFLSLKKCEIRSVPVFQHAGIVCDSGTMTFRIPQDKLDSLHELIQTALDDGGWAYRTLQCIAGECMSMTEAIRPASLSTHVMFAVLSAMEKTNTRRVDLACNANAYFRGEFEQWFSLSVSSHEEPSTNLRTRRYLAGWRHHNPKLPVRAAGVFPDGWLRNHINTQQAAVGSRTIAPANAHDTFGYLARTAP